MEIIIIYSALGTLIALAIWALIGGYDELFAKKNAAQRDGEKVPYKIEPENACRWCGRGDSGDC